MHFFDTKEFLLWSNRAFSKSCLSCKQLFSKIHIGNCYLLSGVFLVLYVLFGNFPLMATLLLLSVAARDTVLLDENFVYDKNMLRFSKAYNFFIFAIVAWYLCSKDTLPPKPLFCLLLAGVCGLQLYNGPKSLIYCVVRTLLIAPIALCLYRISEHDSLPHPLDFHCSSIFIGVLSCLALNCYIMAFITKHKYSFLLSINVVFLLAMFGGLSFYSK
ncbi:MAG: hypothetical protein LBD36_01105 [Holosporales bacterium]|jgi:hypothetical protein|nr:hypothetical protein [Holosporales bacterium]